METSTSTTVVKVTTKLNKNVEKGTETQLTIVWDGSPEQMQKLATRSAVIQYQSICRDAGKIPATDSIKISELFVRGPRTKAPPTPEAVAALAAGDAEYRAALMALLKLPPK